MAKLKDVLENRRRAAGRNGKSLGYLAWGKSLGIVHTSLWRFANDQGTLGIEALRTLAQRAIKSGDDEMIIALAEYALGVEIHSLDNIQKKEKNVENQYY